jgi:type I site-specific restriction-modification system R (restriction) subunit
VWLFDFDNPNNNDWLVVNQFTVVENHVNRRPDVMVFINGLPLASVELKNPADANATVRSAFNQFQTYKKQIPSLFTYNEALVISDGAEARMGTIWKEPVDGILCFQDNPESENAESDAGCYYRPERFGRSAIQNLFTFQGSFKTDSTTGKGQE